MSTIYFSHCWGVFEGGGVRASAHAGAFAAAKAAGITFGRVAGTSGGSIVAALIAAGATSEYVTNALEKTNLSTFLSPVIEKDTVFTDRPFLLRLARKIVTKKWKSVFSVALDSGLYSSEPVEHWVETKLRDLLKTHRPIGQGGPIRFKDLHLPLHVVATDLTNGRPKIWSSDETPEDSVAFAVRCSCTIPFFYQAIGTHQGVLIDGGAVSNLPSFVYSKLMASDEDRSVLSRILAFRLVEDPAPSAKPRNVQEFGIQLANTVISGASEIQASLQPDVYEVVIETGAIKSTDFSKIGEKEKKELHSAGESAVQRFVAAERAIVRANSNSRIYRGFDEEMLLVVQGLMTCSELFCAVGDSIYWLDVVFPMVLAAARRGVDLVCITVDTKDSDQRRRIFLLQQLGVTVVLVEKDKLPFKGFVFDPSTDGGSIVLSTAPREIRTDDDYQNGIIRSYTRSHDAPVMDLLVSKIAEHLERVPCKRRELPYVECAKDDLFAKLKSVIQYRNANFRVRELEVSDEILVMQETVKEFKALQIRQHIRDLLINDCELFDLRKVDFGDGLFSIVTPPVLEQLGAQFVVIDGSARLFHCLSTGVSRVTAVVVGGVEAALPARNPKKLSTLRLSSSTRTMAANYPNLERSLIRRIEEAVHPFSPD